MRFPTSKLESERVASRFDRRSVIDVRCRAPIDTRPIRKAGRQAGIGRLAIVGRWRPSLNGTRTRQHAASDAWHVRNLNVELGPSAGFGRQPQASAWQSPEPRAERQREAPKAGARADLRATARSADSPAAERSYLYSAPPLKHVGVPSAQCVREIGNCGRAP